jgi:hypothetical protein
VKFFLCFWHGLFLIVTAMGFPCAPSAIDDGRIPVSREGFRPKDQDTGDANSRQERKAYRKKKL